MNEDKKDNLQNNTSSVVPNTNGIGKSSIPPQPPAPPLETIRTYEKDLARALSKGKPEIKPLSEEEKPTTTPKNLQEMRNSFVVRPLKNYAGVTMAEQNKPSLVEKKSVTNPEPQPLSPTPPPPPLPTPPPSQPPKPQPVIRTYESDVSDTLENNQANIATMVIAENTRKQAEEGPEPEKHTTKKLIFSLISLLIIGGGIFGGYYLYLKSPLSTPPIITQPIVSRVIIPSDKKSILNIGTLHGETLLRDIYSQFNKASLENNKILEIVLEKNVANPESKKGTQTAPLTVRITGSTFIKTAEVDMPDNLLRSLTDKWMLGIYRESNGQSTPFIAFTTDFFQNTFAGMLGWEKTMPDDLAEIFNYKERIRSEAQNASSTISSYFSIQGKFIDRSIRNRDVREFISRNGELLFLYSFITKDTFVITTTESAFMGLVDRVENQTYVR